MKANKIGLIIVIAIVLILSALYVSQTAHAQQIINICDEEYVGEFECIPSITQEITPTEEVVPTEQITLSPTPTASPSATGDGRSDGKSDGLHTAADGLGCATHPCIPAGAPATGKALDKYRPV